MTSSPPLKPMSSAEESSEPRESEAAQALSELQTQQQRGETGENVFVPPPPAVSSAEETPLSSVPPSPQVSLAYGSPHPPGSFHASLPSADSSLFSPAPPAPGDEASRWFNPSTIRPQSAKLPSRSVKRIASPIELRSPKSRRDSHGSQEPLDMPTSSTGAQLSPAPHQHDPNRASGRARAPASIGSRAPTNTREPQAGGRLARRPRKNPPQPADPGRFVGAPIYYGPGVGMIAPYAFLNSFKTSTPRELGSAGPPSSLGYREPVGSSFHNDPSLAAQGPPLSQPQGFTFPRHRSGHPSPPPGSSAPREVPAHLSPSTSYPVYPPWSLAKPSSSPGSFSLPYGSPGVAIPPTPYQMLPAPKSSGSQAPVQRSSSFQAPAQSSSVEADGYMMIRNAISIDLVREVVAVVERGLPVSKRSETASTYMTPVQAYRVRDDFVKKWRVALRPFYEPMNKTIPKMPTAIMIGAFESSDPMDFRKSLLHIGSKDQLYVQIALTDLSPENGFYTVLRGSHQTKHPGLTPVEDWMYTPITLQEGDAFIWRGDLSYLLSSNGGGKWQSMNFEWGPGLVDLTTE